MKLPVATVLDDVCTQILNAERDLRPVTRVHLAPREYDIVADSKRREIERGNGLVLLGLELVSDETLPPGHIVTD